MEKYALVLRFVASLQSWGERAIGRDIRDTALFPTKSGVVGLLGCALGIERGNKELVALSASLQMAVRADRPGRIVEDFQTARANVMGRANGAKTKKTKSVSNTVIIRRSYLEDSAFTVFLFGEKMLLERLALALQQPKWTLYLGRKSCVPSVPIFDKLTSYETVRALLENYPLFGNDKTFNTLNFIPVEVDESLHAIEGNRIYRNDETLSAFYSFGVRPVIRGVIQLHAS